MSEKNRRWTTCLRMEYLQKGKAIGYFKNDETHQELKLPSGNSCDVAIFERSSLMNDKESNPGKANCIRVPDKKNLAWNDWPGRNRDQSSCLEMIRSNLP